jgi:hypothetical protein
MHTILNTKSDLGMLSDIPLGKRSFWNNYIVYSKPNYWPTKCISRLRLTPRLLDGSCKGREQIPSQVRAVWLQPGVQTYSIASMVVLLLLREVNDIDK